MASAPLKNEHRELRFPQFGLRTLMIVVALAGLLFAVMGWIGPVSSAALLLGLAVVGLHVAGNAIGTSLSDSAPSRAPMSEPRPSDPAASDQMSRERPSPPELPLSRLREHTPLGWIVRVTALVGFGLGTWFGFGVLGQWIERSNFGLFVGTASTAILGGLFGFLLGSFLQMALTAWWQAVCVSDGRRQP